MNIQFQFSWKTKLAMIIVMTLMGLALVSGSAFFGLKNVNGSVRKQNSVVEYEVLAISLAYQLLELESSSAELKKDHVFEYKTSLKAFPELANQMLTGSNGLAYSELIDSSKSLSESAAQYLSLKEQWLLVIDELGFVPTEGELKNLEDSLSAVEKISFSMIEGDVSALAKGQRRYVISKTEEDYSRVDKALKGLEKKVKELNWETNKVGQAIKAYRSDFTVVSDLIAKEESLLESIKPVVEQLNININQQKKFITEVVSQQVIKQADDAKTMATTVIFLVVALVGVMILISLGGIARQLYMQLNDMQGFLKRLAEGDFSQKLTLNNNAKDEFTQLRSANNQMTEDVSSVISQVVQGNKLLLGLREELEVAVERLSGNSIEIEEKTQQSTVATQQISIAVNDVAKRSVHVSQKSQSASKLTKEGGAVVGDCVISMSNIVKLIEDTHNEVANLMQSSSKMLGIIDVINGLADQTNLLALNAAIESARAGEAGRGFSVVADEVRALAQKTVNATSSIGDIINGFNDQSERMGKLMEQGIKLASSGQENANNAMSSFKRIECDIQNVAAEMDQVVVAVEEISYNTNDIAGQVGKICQQTEGAKEIRLSLEEYTHQLSSQVETLENITGRFRLQNRS